MREPLWPLDRDDDSMCIDLTVVDDVPYLITGVQSNNNYDYWGWDIIVSRLENNDWISVSVWSADVEGVIQDEILDGLQAKFNTRFPEVVADPLAAMKDKRRHQFPEDEDGPEILAQGTPIGTIYA